jgi:putative two-component system response regulator
MAAKGRILVIDDNLTNLSIVEEALDESYDILTALDGPTGLQLASRFCPEVVLLDVMMPCMDGYEVCRRIKSNPLTRHSRVIMVSAKTDLNDRLVGYQAGADDYLTKPYSEEELQAKVSVALRTKTSDEFDMVKRQLERVCGFNGEVLALVTQLRDSESGDHLVHVRGISHILAGELRTGPYELQIDDEFIDNLHYASILHDVGKTAIPDHILNRSDDLTPEEFAELKSHTLVGERILNRLAKLHLDVGLYRMAAVVARSHHESFDGSGYPDGMRGIAIPLAARIVKVADEFDRLVSRAGHAGRWDTTGAREELERRSGADFDPVIVDALCSTFDDVVDLYESRNFAETLALTE